MTWSPWAQAYARTPQTYIWGTQPSKLARAMSACLRPGARVLDLGCGEGRDSVFFATCGFEVTGVDVSPAGLQKAERLARAHRVRVRWVSADAAHWVPTGLFDLVYSCGALHYVARRYRARLFVQLQAVTRPGGHHALVVFTDRHIYVEHGERVDYFAGDELDRAYADWLIRGRTRTLITCTGDGTPHRHSVEHFLARKPGAAADAPWNCLALSPSARRAEPA